jgi:2-polyprenyl-6-methoxyphenol hydroxylase-like FAD-dependent oxidoreductase
MSSISDIGEVDILIVGGGPAGLSTALSLQYHTLINSTGETKRPKILIVDSLAEGQNESRALVIHARTLEVTFEPP